MGARWMTNLLLAAVVAALSLLVYFESRREAQVDRLTPIDTEAVTRMAIERKDLTPLAFEKIEGRWWLVAPFKAPAEGERIAQIISIAGIPSRARYGMGEADGTKFGLAPPQATLRVDGTRIDFGDTDPVERRRYARVGQTLHLVDDIFIHLLLAPESDFIDQSPPAVTPALDRIPPP